MEAILIGQKCPVVQPVRNADAVIKEVNSILNERFHAVNAYPFATSANANFELIKKIKWELQGASLESNEYLKVKIILRLHNSLIKLTPKRTFQRAENYSAKVDRLMAWCRDYLGWREQNLPSLKGGLL